MYTLDAKETMSLEALVAELHLEEWEADDLRSLSIGDEVAIDGGFALIYVKRVA